MALIIRVHARLFYIRTATLVEPGKQAVSIRIDRDVLDFLKREDPGYQSRINAILRTYVAARRSR